MRFITVLLICFPISIFSQLSPRAVAYKSIQDLKQSVLLVRLHTDEEVLKKMKKMKQYKMLKAKKQEVLDRNKETYLAFSTGYSFTDVFFFYAKSSSMIADSNLNNVFVNSDLHIDSNIHLPEGKSFYIVDVGDIYFEAYGGHFEGMIVMDRNFIPLKKPFPYYVRKRSGFSLIRRTDMDMVLILQQKFEDYLEQAQNPRR